MTEPLRTYDERFAHILSLIEDTDIEPGEKLKHIYHWMSLEFAILKRDKVLRRIRRHVKWLNDTEDVYRLRKDLSQL